MSIHSGFGSRTSVRSAPGVPRAASAKSFGRPLQSMVNMETQKEARNGKNQKNVAVITVDELHRIKENCFMDKDAEAEEVMKTRKELQMKSKSRVQNWPNTIQALRQKRVEEKFKKLEDEEVLFLTSPYLNRTQKDR